jgi:ankyrin repeat protein
MKAALTRRRLLRPLLVCCLLTTVAACCPEALGQGGRRRCEKVPASNWSVSFRPHTGPGRETSPYQILSMNLEACNGYLYMSDVGLAAPPDRLFFTVEFMAFVYKAAEPDKPLFQLQIYRIGSGDGELASDGVWRTTAGRKWGAPFTAGDSPLMLPLMRDGALEGEYVIEVGICFISFGKDDVWRSNGWQKTAPDPAKPLLDAADNDDVAAIRSLLAAGADVNARGPFNETPLIRAASSGYEKSVRLLIRSGADVNAKSLDGFTPLILAAQYGHTPVVRFLLEAGADLAAENNDGMSAVYSACFQGRTEVWEVLKAAGAGVRSPSEELVCQAGLGRTAAVERLLADGVTLNAKGPRDYTALLLASLNGHADTVRLLLARGADANMQDKYQWSPLNWAMFAHHAEVAKMLLKAGADINHRNAQGATPLIEAARATDIEGARLLVEAGADLAARDNAGKTALDHAVAQANTGPVQEGDPLVKLLRSALAKR